ncbi:MAG: TonB-dependent receptor, partial [Moraxellaceae bacterium]
VIIDRPLVQVAVTLKPASPDLLAEVLVQKQSVKREIERSGFAVNVIETKEAGLRNIQTNDLLDRTVGVRIRQNGGLGSNVDYNLNGMSGNSVRIFIDGIPISTYGSSFSLNSIPPALIERIEIYKGVIPAHLADDALGGAINVILKKGAGNLLNASISYGSFNTFQSNVNGAYQHKSGFTVKASGFYNYSDNDYEVWGKFVYNILPNGRYDYVRAKRFNDAYKSYGGRVEAGFTDVRWADTFLIGYTGSHDYNQIQHGQFMTIPYKGRFTEADAHVFTLNYAKKDVLLKGLDVTLTGAYSKRTQVVNDTVKWNYNWSGERAIGLYGDPILTPNGAQQGAPTINHIRRNILSARAGLVYNINANHRLIVNSMLNTVDRNDRDELMTELQRRFRQTRDLRKNVTSFAYDAAWFSARLKSSLFGKYYSQNIVLHDPVAVTENGETTVSERIIESRKETFGYGLALSYGITEPLLIMASAERAVRMPSEGEVFGSPGENIIANPAISPEVSDNFNIGLRYGAKTIGKHKFTFQASGFLRDTKDKIVRQTSSRLNDAIQTLPFVNLGKTQAIGFEASVDYAYNQTVFIGANMSRFNSLFKMKYDANGNLFPYYDKQIPNEPYFTVNGNARYDFKDIVQRDSNLNFYYSCGYVHPFYTLWLQLDSFRTPAQYIHDLGVTYAFPGKQFVLSFDARNITDRQAYDNYAVQKPGRAFYVKLNYTIRKI